jgi:hypothetical protein
MLHALSGYNILYPVFLQVALTLGLGAWGAARRIRIVRSGEIKPKQFALGQPVWPADITQINNSYSNQFEMPVLFYVAVFTALSLNKADPQMGLLAWLFVALRYWHAYVHTTSNYIPMRARAFLLGAGVLAVMWGMLFFSFAIEGI